MEDNSLRIYTLFKLFREVFCIHLINGYFLKLMDKKEEEDRFTYNPCVHVMKYFSIKKPLFGDFSLSLSLSLDRNFCCEERFLSLSSPRSLSRDRNSVTSRGGRKILAISLSLPFSLSFAIEIFVARRDFLLSLS